MISDTGTAPGHDDQDHAGDDAAAVVTIGQPAGKPAALAPGRRWPMIGPPSGA
jgi:hypothetical protein